MPLSGRQRKRLLDVVVAGSALAVTAPVLPLLCGLIWCQDGHSPVYLSNRIGRNGETFVMLKLRTMVHRADSTGVDSTAASDERITPLGRILRRSKLDELPQLVHVLRGEMSLVGPRPNVPREVRLYTETEKRLLSVQPGITDMASIVFADLADIIDESADPDISYNQLVRPWKSSLGLFYVDHQSVRLDLELLAITAVALVARPVALRAVARLLRRYGADDDLCRIALRGETLVPLAPPGSTDVVLTRSVVNARDAAQA